MRNLMITTFIASLLFSSASNASDVNTLRKHCTIFEKLLNQEIAITNENLQLGFNCGGFISALSESRAATCYTLQNSELNYLFPDEDSKRTILENFGSDTADYTTIQLVRRFMLWANRNPDSWNEEMAFAAKKFFPTCKVTR